MIKKEELYFDSRDNVTKLHAIRWIPEEKANRRFTDCTWYGGVCEPL